MQPLEPAGQVLSVRAWPNDLAKGLGQMAGTKEFFERLELFQIG